MTELFLFFSTFGRAGGTSGLLGGELVAAKAHVNHVINSHGRHCAIVTWASWFGKMETHPDPFPTRPDPILHSGSASYCTAPTSLYANNIIVYLIVMGMGHTYLSIPFHCDLGTFCPLLVELILCL